MHRLSISNQCVMVAKCGLLLVPKWTSTTTEVRLPNSLGLSDKRASAISLYQRFIIIPLVTDAPPLKMLKLFSLRQY